MSLHMHKWSKWSEGTITRRYLSQPDHPYQVAVQWRRCEKCGKKKIEPLACRVAL